MTFLLCPPRLVHPTNLTSGINGRKNTQDSTQTIRKEVKLLKPWGFILKVFNLEGSFKEDGVGRRKSGSIRFNRASFRVLGIKGTGKAMSLEAGVWAKTVTENGRRFSCVEEMRGRRAVGHRQEKREAPRQEQSPKRY